MRDANMRGRTTVESFRKLLLHARDTVGLKPILYKDYFTNVAQADIFLIRHDVDHSLDNAMMLARIEKDMGMSSTYFMLHPGDYGKTENYYGRIEKDRIVHNPVFFERCRELQDMGHEVAIHNDFFQLSFHTRRPIIDLIREEVEAFTKAGIPVVGSASHGSAFVREIEATNYEVFSDCVSGGRETGRAVASATWGAKTHAFSMKDVGLSYEAYFLPRNMDISDTGSSISITARNLRHSNFNINTPEAYKTIEDIAKGIDGVRLVMLIHPCWWSEI